MLIMSLNAVTIIAAPEMTNAIPAPTFPKAVYRPKAAAAAPARISVRFPQSTPFSHASFSPSNNRSRPPMAMAMPATFVPMSPSMPGNFSEIFQRANPAPISATSFAIFFSLSEIESIKLKSGSMSAELLPPLSPLSLFISSNEASCLPADFAALPTPCSAFFCSFRDFAAPADSLAVEPNRLDTTFAMTETTAVSTFTSAVKAGMIICTNG